MPIPESVPFYGSVKDQLIAEIRANGHAVTGIYVGRQALVLTTTGVRSGEPRVSPLAYSTDGGCFVVTASRGGSPRHPSWYHNLAANPIVTVEVDGEVIQARARIAGGSERERLWTRHVALHPGIGAYREMTSREIPVVVLQPIR